MGGKGSKKEAEDDSPTKGRGKSKRKNSGGASPPGSKRGSKRGSGAGMSGIAGLAKAKSMASGQSKKLDEADPNRKWERIRDNLLAEVGQSELAAKATEAQVERLEANISKVEKEVNKLYKNLKKIKKALRKVGEEKDDIVAYLEDLEVEQAQAFDEAEVLEGAVDTFVFGKAKAAVKKIKKQNAFVKAFAGAAKRR